MLLQAETVLVLISDDDELPSWIPIELFQITDCRMDSSWLFQQFSNPGGIRALWGYARLIQDDEHFDALVERDPGALRVFYEEKHRMSVQSNAFK
ncbi:hypothetical protein [Luteibacter yeojuensis]|nr:hypothetical protein [Luteibacter yeojuensis]